jgi:flavin-dependent dehydrogenase
MSPQAHTQNVSSEPRGSRRVLIVGGVAGGASCAARLRRLDESVEIVMFDRGPYVSFANCGLALLRRQRYIR